MTEIETYHSPSSVMLDPITDSWTAVVGNVAKLAQQIAHTEFVPAGLRGQDGAKVAAAILTGRELGLPPMTALSAIHIINGKPGISAEMMRGLVLQAGHQIVFAESSSQRVVMKGRRDGDEEWTTVTWTDQDANRAGLKGGNYAKYPRQMLAARCTTELCRLAFADVIHGLRSIEELEGMGDDDALDLAPEPTPVKRQRRAPKVQPVDQEPDTGPVEPTERRSPALTRRGATTAAPDPGAERAPKDADSPAASAGPDGDGSGAPADPSEPAPPEDEPTADHDTGEVHDDVVDDEVVDDEVDAEPRISKAQLSMLMPLFMKLGVSDRAERLQITTDLVGRPLESANNLSKTEASSVIETLTRCETRDDLENVIRSTVAHRDGDAS